MKRETTNIIRFIIEECLPPIVRDWKPLNAVFTKMSGIDLEKCRALREDIPNLTSEKLAAFYASYPRVQDDTDNSEACLKFIKDEVDGSVCDVGCGTGYTLNFIKETCAGRMAGVDFTVHEEWKALPEIEFFTNDVLALPFNDNEFDTIISTHTIEHVLDIPAYMRELRRVAAKKIIIVTPRERESKYSFNPHFHYFPYEYSLLKTLLPLPEKWSIKRLGRDYGYVEYV